MMEEELTPEQLAHMQELAELFETLRYVRHQKGQEEYGVATFLENDLIRMMCEELADTANYCQYQFIKLMTLQERLTEMLESTGDEDQLAQMGIGTFRGAGKEWEDANRPNPSS